VRVPSSLAHIHAESARFFLTKLTTQRVTRRSPQKMPSLVVSGSPRRVCTDPVLQVLVVVTTEVNVVVRAGLFRRSRIR
jgi:hypothetical protein